MRKFIVYHFLHTHSIYTLVIVSPKLKTPCRGAIKKTDRVRFSVFIQINTTDNPKDQAILSDTRHANQQVVIKQT